MKLHNFPAFVSLILPWFILMASCSDASRTGIHQSSNSADDSFLWNLPRDLPLPIGNPINPMSEEKFQLGRHLFYDARLSGNGKQSCSSCHQQDKAFTDGRSLAVGSTGDILPRNTQSLTNVAFNATLTWANPALQTLEQQIKIPLFAENPVEHGITSSNWPAIQANLKVETRYEALFKSAFPGESEYFTQTQVIHALAIFVRGMLSFDSPYDRHLLGDDSEYSASAVRGQALFFSEQMECFHCHGGYNFSDSTADRSMSFVEKPFHNTGLFNIDGSGRYPDRNRGIFEVTSKATDMGRFRAPSLRNIARTAPYMHDGSVADLGSVLDLYAAGGRNITEGPQKGDGRKNPFKDGFVTGFKLSTEDKKAMISFLESLTDDRFLTNPRFSNPW